MKKLLAVVAVVGLVGFATSCKKECKCTLDGKDFPTVGTLDTKELCDAFQASSNLAQELLGAEAPKVKCEWK